MEQNLVCRGYLLWALDNALTLSSLLPENLQREDIQSLAKRVSYRYPEKAEIPFPTYFPGLIL